MKVDPLKPRTEGWLKRQRVHRHNSFNGHVRMIEMNLINMIGADSVSLEAKRVIHAMLGYTDQLKDLIKTRIDE